MVPVGTRLGPYEIIALLGAGGMGEVYRARDTRLNRDVALKVLPEAFMLDPDRLARFKREAQVLASLNHPSIAAIYGLEESNGVQALVLELIEGPTLADRIARGPIPLDEVLPIARQVAEALEAAHEQGIVHRDLKPANIKVRPDGTVKVLDCALLLEVVLLVTLVPLSFVNITLFLTAVPIGVFAFGYLVSWWILRKVPLAPILHGALIGIVATAMYLGLVFAQPGGFAAAVATYGVPLFWFSQAMRIAGCVAGAARNPRPAAPSSS